MGLVYVNPIPHSNPNPTNPNLELSTVTLTCKSIDYTPNTRRSDGGYIGIYTPPQMKFLATPLAKYVILFVDHASIYNRESNRTLSRRRWVSVNQDFDLAYRATAALHNCVYIGTRLRLEHAFYSLVYAIRRVLQGVLARRRRQGPGTRRWVDGRRARRCWTPPPLPEALRPSTVTAREFTVCIGTSRWLLSTRTLDGTFRFRVSVKTTAVTPDQSTPRWRNISRLKTLFSFL